MTVPGLAEFLENYPRMSVQPITSSDLILDGEFQFVATVKDREQILDSYRLRILIPRQFPAALPKVMELGGKIPRRADFHVNSDASLCLGSPLRLLMRLSMQPTLSGFASHCLIPYLYAVSHKLRFGGELPFSELKHGRIGELEDYMDLLALKGPEQVQQAIRLLGMKKQRANKEPCPCGCGRCLGRCSFNRRLRRIRRLASRSWFRRLGVA